jgi:hypothetical protein
MNKRKVVSSKPSKYIVPESKLSMSPKIAKRNGNYIKPREIDADIQIDYRNIMGCTPISEVIGESSHTHGNFKSRDVRESAETRLMSHRFEDTDRIEEKIIDNDVHSNDEDDSQPDQFSYRSKLDYNHHKESSHPKKKESFVDRLYTLKSDPKKTLSKTINPIIMIEDNQDNKYKGFLNNSLIEPAIRDFTGNQTVVHKKNNMLSPFKIHHRHKHSNSDTLVKSSSFKSSHNHPLVSKYAKQKSLSPNNPELIISK